MQELINNRRGKNGFTLAELLIVVAIIAVLVAIAIPIFTSQLEKSREATDLANIRAAYAEVMTAALNNESKSVDVVKQQKKDGWEGANADAKIGNTKITDIDAGNSGTVTVSFTEDGSTITIGNKEVTF